MILEDLVSALSPIFAGEVHPVRRRQVDMPNAAPLLPAAVITMVSDDWQAGTTACGISDLHEVRVQVDVYAKTYQAARGKAIDSAHAMDAIGGIRLTMADFPDFEEKAYRYLLDYRFWRGSDFD
jgi:hypothetical protein